VSAVYVWQGAWHRTRLVVPVLNKVLIFAPVIREEVAAAILVPFRAAGLHVFVPISAVGIFWAERRCGE
jgi:hypothetical protein